MTERPRDATAHDASPPSPPEAGPPGDAAGPDAGGDAGGDAVLLTGGRAVFLFLLLAVLGGLVLHRGEILGPSATRSLPPRREHLSLPSFDRARDAARERARQEESARLLAEAAARRTAAGEDGATAAGKSADAPPPAGGDEPASTGRPDDGPRPASGADPGGAAAAAREGADGEARAAARAEAAAGGTASSAAVAARSGPRVETMPEGIGDWSQVEITAAVPRANIVIYPPHRVLMLRSHDQVVRVYRNIAVPADTSAPKRTADDNRAPEGDYRITIRTSGRKGKRLALNYPNVADAGAALEEKRITPAQHRAIVEAAERGRPPPWNTPLGGFVYIEEGRDVETAPGSRFVLPPGEMAELWTAAPVGTPVLIRH